MNDDSKVPALRDPILAELESARRHLAEATDISEVKNMHAVAAGAEVYARRQQLSDEAIGLAHRVKIEALARLGELLKEIRKATGTRGQLIGRGIIGGSEEEPPINSPPTLAELGITKKTSMVAQWLAEMPPDLREQIAAGEMTITKARRQVAHEERAASPPLPTKGCYRVLYADPPWEYGNSGLQQYGHASFHYPTMTIPELCELPVSEIAEPDSVLFLWVTSPFLEEALEVVNAWGFRYKTSFVWDKVKHNFGHYNSVRHEILLVSTRGSCTPDVRELFDSVQSIERTAHSRKPERFREIIDTIYPHGNRVELFAREKPPGAWDAWGNELAVAS